MTLAIATFWRENNSTNINSKPLYRYLIIEEETKRNDRIVSITALTSPAPMPSDDKHTFVVNNLTPQEAIEKAYETIYQHPQLNNLKSKLSYQNN